MPGSSEPGPPRPGPGSSLVALRPADSSPDDAPTVITPPKPEAPPDLGLAPDGRLGGFRIIESVGAGGMAAVLKAKDVDLGRVVALKILPPHMARDPENVARFKLEARAAAQLDHDNVARVFACGEDRGLHFIAFEFVEGETLRALMDRRGLLPPAECVRYLAQVAAGLAHAADRGVVHRDVKPSNIIVTPDGRAKLVDMGLARSLAGGSVNGGVTQSGVTLGTFDYISPEQALDPRRADARSDIYSLGCTVYHALTGRPPVPPGTAAKKLHAHQHEPPVDPRLLNPLVPDSLTVVLAKMMAKDPDRRYQSPRELLAAVAGLAAELGLSAELLPADARGSTLHQGLPAAPGPRPSPGLAVGVGAVALAAAVFVAVAGPGRGPAPAPPWEDTALGSGVSGPGSGQTPAGAGVAGLGSGQTPNRKPQTPTPLTADELAAALENPAVSEVKLAAGNRYDLTTLPAGVVARPRPELTITGNPANPPTLVVGATPVLGEAWDSARPRSLTVHVTALTVRGVRFELADGPTADDPLTDGPADRPVGVLVWGADRVAVTECRFEPSPGLMLQDLAGLAVARSPTSSPADRTQLTMAHCYFGVRRGAGVQLAGAVSAKVRECGFAPHPAAVGLRADPAAIDTADASTADLDLDHCTFLLDKGAAIDAADAAWAVTAGQCVFAGVPPDPAAMAMLMADTPPPRPAVIRAQTDPPTVRYSGRANAANAYFGADPEVAAGRVRTFADLARRPADGFADPGAVELKQAPWAAPDPLARLDRPAPWQAFRLAADRPQVQAGRTDGLLGVRFLPTESPREESVYPTWPPGRPVSSPMPTADARVKVWWAGAPAGRREGLPADTFAALADALEAVQSGDELHVRHDGPGELVVPVFTFDRPGLKLTVRPAPGSRVTLVPHRPMSAMADTSIVRVAAGDLTLDGFDLRVPAVGRGGRAAVAAVGGRVTLKNCTVTLDGPTDEPGRASGVVVESAGETTRATEPTVRLENTLVRGFGRGVWVAAARPCEVALTDVVTAVSGPVLAIGPASSATPNPPVRVSLSRVTAGLGGPVLDVRGAGPAVRVDADRCVFAAGSTAGPLVTTAGDPERAVVWSASAAGNWYANRPADAPYLTGGPGSPWDADRWLGFTREPATAVVPRVQFRRWPATDLAGVTPGDLAVVAADADGRPAGARVERVGPTTP